MQPTAKGHSEADKNLDIDTIARDIASLRGELATLIEHMKAGAIDGVTEEAQRLYGSLAEKSQHSVRALGRHVEEKPMMSLLIAFGIGFIGSRLLSR